MSGTEEPGYGASAPGPNPYVGQGYQPYQQPYQPGQIPWGPPPDHPEASKALVFGVLGFALCQVLSPFALVIGARVRREIDASQGRVGGRQYATIGWILGLVGTIMLVLGVLAGLGYVALIAVSLGASV